MKALIWCFFAILMLGWSGMAWLSAELVDWLVHVASTAPAGQAAQAIGQWPVPGWIALWISPEVIQALQAVLLDGVGWVGAWLPSLDSLAGVINAVVWIVWAIGALILLLIAGFAHWLTGLGRGKSSQPAH